MKKKLFIGMLGIAAMLASCSQDEGLAQGATDGLKAVTVAVNLEDAGSYARSRSLVPNTAEADAAVTRCYMEVIEKGVSIQLVSMAGDQASGFTATLTLNPANDYRFLFWADGGEDYYTITNEAGKRLQDIAVANDAAVSVAYQYATVWDKGSTVEANLTHAVAKVSVRTTTDLDSGGTLTLTLPTYTGYNVGSDTDKLLGDETSHEYSMTLTDPITVTDANAGALVFSCYVLYDGTDDLNLTYGKTPDTMCPATIYNVPLKPNQHTILLGDVANLGLISTTITANISSDWADGGTTSQFPQAAKADSDTHTIVTGVAGQIAAEPSLITDAMDGNGTLRVVGPMNQADMKAISAYKNTITELDLSEATGEIAITFQAFLQSASLTKVKLGSNVTSIDYNAFAVCTYLQEVDLSACSNLTSIKEAAFTSCDDITTLKLPMNGKLATIGPSAFINCDKIQSITFPETLTQIGDWMFGETTTIETLVFLSQEAPSVATDNNVGGDFTDLFYGSETEKKNKMSNVTIYLPNVQREDAEAKGWTAFFVDETNYGGVKYGESPATVNP